MKYGMLLKRPEATIISRAREGDLASNGDLPTTEWSDGRRYRWVGVSHVWFSSQIAVRHGDAV